MSTNKPGYSPPIQSYEELAAYMQAGEKPRSRWKIGTEHEKFCFTISDLKPLPYQGQASILTLFQGLMDQGWQPIEDQGNIIALEDQQGATISLEPGGQFELSGAPVSTLHQTCDEAQRHLAQVKRVAQAHGIGMIGLGFTPQAKLVDMPLMPKGRYDLMKRYMPKVGTRGHDMMFRTCTIQVNLDFESEGDMAAKMRLGQLLQPLATALFANAPLREGQPTGRASERAYAWLDVDEQRAGLLGAAIDGKLTYEAYADYALNVPMYFVLRDGRGFIDARGQSFRHFMEGKLPALPGERPTVKDWENHLSTLFPEARLKRFIEMRGADGGPWRHICALPAFWVGLLYDANAQLAALDLTKDWTLPELQTLRQQAPRSGIATQFRGRSLQAWLSDLLAICEAGLKARSRSSSSSADETEYLAAPQRWVAQGRGPADEVLDLFAEVGGDMCALHNKLAF